MTIITQSGTCILFHGHSLLQLSGSPRNC